ncbi:BCSC C-terminal domain-containing protein [Luteimonas sp. BDR2-5]|uniref:cellulose biosynthesis protein BcsC n=1 Tax=Proluteimonas luteida TaxID=2878685 RepID=UPI001E32E688|nr:cellulose biosynthesis protein BcsC [Luteimonas sp. BDR2-5]MCD9027072.1 BCSC C-terminal domain-containing protein [Luteimonas sp. BDR2-5]
MFRKSLRPICLAGLSVLAAPALAQSTSATQQLINQGNYWHDQGRDDLAIETWNKLLAVDPRQPDALLGMGLIDLAQGRRAQAQRRLQQLQAAHPDAPQTARLRIAMGGGATNDLNAARRAASAGRYAEAVAAYEKAFGSGGPPSSLALEYYQALAGTRDGWMRARDGIRALVDRDPADTAAALALAQVMTYRESSRREGIARLRELSRRADTGRPATAAWRQALLWLDAAPADAPLYQAFLDHNANDAEVAAKAAELHSQAARRVVQDAPEQRLLGEGFRALDAGNLAQAESRFAQVLRTRPNDADARGGLGTVRLRQQRFAEARELLRPAAAADAKWRQAADTARYWLTLQTARDNVGDNTLDEVQQVVALLPREPAGYALLADLQVASDPAAAERNYRRALELDASNAAALQGLAGLYGRQGRADEAAALIARLTPEQQAQAGGADALRAMVARARAREALDEGNTAVARIELEDAMLAQPRDPWVRLELARLYSRDGRPDQARSIMEGLLALDAESPQALFANALYAQERGDWSGAYASLERIPAGARDAEMAALHDVAWVHLQGEQARTLMQRNRAGEAQLLLARAESALGDGLQRPAVAAALAGAYADIGSQQRALLLGRRLVDGPSPTLDDRLEFASVLLRAGQDAELSALLRQLRDTPMPAAQADRYEGLRADYSLRQVDALRELGNLEGAYDALAPILAARPQDPGNVAALARLYSAAGDHAQALALYQQQLQLAPGDTDALLAAAGSAAAMRDLGTAEQYLEHALAQAPESPEVLAAAGRVYRAAGRNRKAERYFRAALAAQARESGQFEGGYPIASTALAGAGGRPFNPFSGLTGPGARAGAIRGDGLQMPPAAAQLAAAPLPARVPTRAPLPSTHPAGAAAAAPVALVDDDGLPAPVTAGAAVPSYPVPGQRSAAVAAPRAGVGPDVASAPLLPPLPAPGGSGNPVLDELRELRGETSSSLAAGAAYRARAGEGGLGALDELAVPLEGRFQLGEGKLRATVTPTILDAGTLGADYPSASRFGAGPQAALADALAADRNVIDDYIGSSLFQLLTTEGNNNASRNLFYRYAVSTGLYSRLYTEYGNDADTREAIYRQPLFAYLLDIEAANTTIGTIATAVLNNPAMTEDMSAGDLAALKALSDSSVATAQTPTGFSTALYSLAATGASSRRIDQSATGAGVSIGYEIGGLRADIGTSPLGFRETSIVGGVGYRGQAGELLTWSAEASRRPVTDSLLSFSGTEDPRTGIGWGGVTATGGKLSATLDNGLIGGYGNLAWYRLEGENVADNEHQELGLGMYVHALETQNQSLTAGLNLTALRYDTNLRGFTFGHGGYFSPQEYVEVGFPVRWNGRTGNRRLTWGVDASIGVQHFKEDPTPYFPTRPDLQQAAYDAASLAALLGLTSEYFEPVFPGQTKTGVSYNLTGASEWQLSPQLFLGGRLEFNNARDYRQFNTNLYLRFLLDSFGGTLGRQPQPLRTPYADGE